jgi:hypothetical protein
MFTYLVIFSDDPAHWPRVFFRNSIVEMWRTQWAIPLAFALCAVALPVNAARRHGGEASIVSPQTEPLPAESSVKLSGKPGAESEAPPNPNPNSETTKTSDQPTKDAKVLERTPNPVPEKSYGPPGSLEWFVNMALNSVAKSYHYGMWVLGLGDQSKTIEERGRTAVHRALWIGVLLLLTIGGGAGYYLFKRRNETQKTIVAESNEVLSKTLEKATIEIDPKVIEDPKVQVFDPSNRPYRVAMLERDGVKVAVVEVLDLKLRQVVEAKDLVPGAVLLAQYLPADRQMHIGVLNGLEQVKYLGDWEFAKTRKEVKILVRDPAAVAA